MNLEGCLLDSYPTLRSLQKPVKNMVPPLNNALTPLGKYACMHQSMRSFRMDDCTKLGLTNGIVGRSGGRKMRI
jgi:hypothetical protein